MSFPHHPEPYDKSYSSWASTLLGIVSKFQSVSIFSSNFSTIHRSILLVQPEAIFELQQKIDRSIQSVYERPDYLVAEILRQDKLKNFARYLIELGTALVKN